MYGRFQKFLQEKLAGIREAGLYKSERVIEGPQGARIAVGGREVINMCANNYLGLAHHPAVEAAAKAMIDKRGYGLSSVRFICGKQDIHGELEKKLSEFLQIGRAHV